MQLKRARKRERDLCNLHSSINYDHSLVVAGNSAVRNGNC